MLALDPLVAELDTTLTQPQDAVCHATTLADPAQGLALRTVSPVKAHTIVNLMVEPVSNHVPWDT